MSGAMAAPPPERLPSAEEEPAPTAPPSATPAPPMEPAPVPAGPAVRVLVDVGSLSPAAEAELRAAVGAFADTVGGILQRDAGASDGRRDDSDAKLTPWLDHFGAFRVDHSAAVAAAVAAAATTTADQSADGAAASPPPAGPSASGDGNQPSAVVAAIGAPSARLAATSTPLPSRSPVSPAAKRPRTAPTSSPGAGTSASDANGSGHATPGSTGRRRSGARSSQGGGDRYMSMYTHANNHPNATTAAADGGSGGGASSVAGGAAAFKPGQLSAALREALGMATPGGGSGARKPGGRQQDAAAAAVHAPYLKRMREMGWPPGWTAQRYDKTRQVWLTVPSIPKTSFPGLNWTEDAPADAVDAAAAGDAPAAGDAAASGDASASGAGVGVG